MQFVLPDAAGYRRSSATMLGYHPRPPRNKGEEYPADPPTIEEIVAVVRGVGAPLRPPSGRPPLRAHRVARPGINPRATESTTGFLAELPYHPHIQHANLGITSIYLQGIDSSRSSAPSTDGHHRRSPRTPASS
jgi:hypothetical protein